VALELYWPPFFKWELLSFTENYWADNFFENDYVYYEIKIWTSVSGLLKYLFSGLRIIVLKNGFLKIQNVLGTYIIIEFTQT